MYNSCNSSGANYYLSASTWPDLVQCQVVSSLQVVCCSWTNPHLVTVKLLVKLVYGVVCSALPDVVCTDLPLLVFLRGKCCTLAHAAELAYNVHV